MPYMLRDPQMALVRSKQAFYNLPKPASHSFYTFINSTEPLECVYSNLLQAKLSVHYRDSRSGFLMRRAGLDDIGGFPTGSSVEDGQLSALLRGKGYRVSFVEESLAFGLIPDSFTSHLRQRLVRCELIPLR